MKKIDAYNIYQLREMARKRLPKGVFENLDRGVEDDIALKSNRCAYERIKLIPRLGIDVSKRSTSAMILGQEHTMPLAISPTGGVGLLRYQGDLLLAKAAAKFGIPIALSMASMMPMEKIIGEAGGRVWFQLYIWADQALSKGLLMRARDAKADSLIVTIDGPVAGNREYNRVNGFVQPFALRRRSFLDFALHPRWVGEVIGNYVLRGGMPRFANFPEGFNYKITQQQLKGRSRGDTLTWDDVKRFRDLWPRKFLVKGVLHPDDARRAIECGADAIIISNHGGRYLDSAVAPIDMVRPIMNAVSGRAEVLVDSGVRRGSDIIKAIGNGASGCMIGRATLYGLAAAGENGAFHTLKLLQKEFSDHLAMLGCLRVQELGPHIFGPRSLQADGAE